MAGKVAFYRNVLVRLFHSTILLRPVLDALTPHQHRLFLHIAVFQRDVQPSKHKVILTFSQSFYVAESKSVVHLLPNHLPV